MLGPCAPLSALLFLLPLPAQELRELESGHVPESRIEPNAMVAGDLDGDGSIDLVIAQSPRQVFDGSERLWLNDGQGRFRDASSGLPTATDGFTYGLVLGDVDSDGDLDLFTLGGTTQLWINDGRARFTDRSARLPAQGQADGHVGLLADFDRDGDLDFVRVGVHTDAYLVNTGGGNFVLGAALPFARTGSGARVLAFYPTAGRAADLNGDGNLDIFLANPFVLFAGDGRGNFTDVAHGVPAAGASPQSIAVADMDGDGDLDLAAALWGNPTLQPVRAMLLANQGNGTFVETTATAMPNAFNSHAVAFADVDGDGVLDLIVGRDAPPTVMLGDGRGGFTSAPTALQPSASQSNLAVVPGDLDGDGRIDLACASLRLGPGPSYWGRVELYTNSGSELLLLNPPRLPRFPTHTARLRLADVDGDGDLDVWRATIGDSPLLRNDGSGYFTGATAQQLGIPVELGATAVAAADYDGDGDLDAFVGLGNGTGVLLDNVGGAQFAARSLTTTTAGIGDAGFADVDGDGDLDLIVGSWGQPQLWLGDGTGTFVLANGRLPAVDAIAAVELSDVDGDGDVDALLGVSIGVYASQARLLLNDGSGTLRDAPPTSFSVPGAVRDARLFDWNGDGRLDVLLATGAGLQLHENTGGSSFRDVSAAVLPAGLDLPIGIAVADLDGDGVAEVLVARNGGNRCLRRAGAGYALTTDLLPADPFGASFAAGDVDRDGDVDVYAGRSLAGQGTADLLYLNLDHQLHAPVAPRLGRPYELRLDRWRPNATGALAAFPFVAFGTLTPRLSLPPYGEIGLDPQTLIPLAALPIPGANGTATVGLTLPPQRALHGLPFAAQALIAPGIAVADWRFTGVTQQRLLR